MLGLDFSELLIIGVVALVVVGPKELPQLMRTIGQWVGKARRMASEFQGQMNEAIREAELDDVKKHVDDLRSLSPKALIAEQFSSVGETLEAVRRDTDAELAKIEAGVGPSPSGAGSAMSAFTVEETAAAAIEDSRVVASIDRAAGAPMDLGPPVFDLTPAPGSPTEVAEAAPAVIADGGETVDAKKERDA